MIKLSAARKYAKLYFEIAVERSLVDTFDKDLHAVGEMLAAVPELAVFLNNRIVDAQDRVAALREVTAGQGLHESTINLMALLVESGRIRLLPHIVKYFQDFCDIHAGRVRATVRVPAEIDEADKAAVVAVIEKATGRKAVVTTEADASLIGGIWVKVGDVIYDSTVKRQLEILKDTLIKG